MAYYKIFPNQDSYIDSNSNCLYNNYGDNPILRLSLTSNSVATTFTRGLIQFPISNSQFNTLTGSYTATLNLLNCRNGSFTDENFTLELHPLTQQWNQGLGTVNNSVTTAVNYIQATNISNWSTSGASYTSSPSASVTFLRGTESLSANINNFIEYWRSNPNYGLLIKYPNLYESLTSNYCTNKTFFSLEANTIFKPFIDICYSEPLIKDDKDNLHIGSNNFFFTDINVSGTAYPGTFGIKTDLSVSAIDYYTPTYFGPNQWFINVTNSYMDWYQFAMVVSNTAMAYSLTSMINGSQTNTSFNDINISRVDGNVVRMGTNYHTDESDTVKATLFYYVGKNMGTYAISYYPQKVSLGFIERNTRFLVTPFDEMNYDASGYFLNVSFSNFLQKFWYIPVIKIENYGQVKYKEIDESSFYVN